MDRQRLSYLQRLGVDVYIPRAAEVTEVGQQEPATSAARQLGCGASQAAGEGLTPAAVSPVTPGAATPEPTGERPEGAGSPAYAGGGLPDNAPDSAVAELDWAGLEQAVAACRVCKLCADRTQTVFGVGDRQADLVLVGEGPGAEEDRLGEPFVGRAGKLLDAMLAAIDRGRERGGVYICNIVKCRPPGNREPRPAEVAACSGYLRRQLELLEPKLIVALGRVAAQKLLDSSASLGNLRGGSHTYADTGIPVWVTYHPAYLLRFPAEKAKSWQDLKRIRGAL